MPLDKDIENILDPLLGTFDERLEAEIAGQLTEVYISGQAEMITWGKTKGGIPIAYEGPPIQGAIDWAGEHAATLVKGLDEETQRRLAHTISEGIKNKRGVPGLSRDIRNTFDDMSKYRGELIARTETATALSQSSLDNMEAMGIEGKEWVTVGDADVSVECRGNEAEGVIPVGKEFSGGVMAPGQHPNCRCALAPGRIKGKAPEVKPVTSLSDAASQAKSIGLSNKVDYTPAWPSGMTKRGWGSALTTEKDKLRRYNVVAGEFSRLKGKYPNMKFGAIDELKLTNTTTGRATRLSIYVKPTDKMRSDYSILLSPKKQSAGQLRRESLHRQTHKNPRTVLRPDMWEVDGFRHELGHHITYQNQEIRKNWQQLYTDNVINRDWVGENISDYALGNSDEALAELFTKVTMPDYKWGTLPAKVEAIAREMLGEI